MQQLGVDQVQGTQLFPDTGGEGSPNPYTCAGCEGLFCQPTEEAEEDIRE